jgi:hypothetical protein
MKLIVESKKYMEWKINLKIYSPYGFAFHCVNQAYKHISITH